LEKSESNIVTTEAWDFAIGAVVSQFHGNEEHLIAFESGILNCAQRNYPVFEKEMFAVRRACEVWRPYLDGGSFQVFTDPKSLEHVFKQRDLIPRMARWMEYLSRFQFTIIYRRGIGNLVARTWAAHPCSTT
jgi:hypothetical protein